MKFVTMRHPDLAGTATSTEGAFNDVWSARGWVLVTDEPAVDAPTEDQTPSPETSDAASDPDNTLQGGHN